MWESAVSADLPFEGRETRIPKARRSKAHLLGFPVAFADVFCELLGASGHLAAMRAGGDHRELRSIIGPALAVLAEKPRSLTHLTGHQRAHIRPAWVNTGQV